MSRRRAQRLDVVLVAVMEMVSGGKMTRGVRRTSHIVLVVGMGRISGGKLTRSVRRAPQMVLVAGGEGGMGGYEKWDDRVIPFFGICTDCAVWTVGALWYPL